MLTKKQENRIRRMIDFNKKNPDKYCWAELYCMAITDDRDERLELRDAAKDIKNCYKDLERAGKCWCGKFVKN